MRKFNYVYWGTNPSWKHEVTFYTEGKIRVTDCCKINADYWFKYDDKLKLTPTDENTPKEFIISAEKALKEAFLDYLEDHFGGDYDNFIYSFTNWFGKEE